MSEKIVDLKLVKTLRSDPVVVVEQRLAREVAGTGKLLWEGGSYHIHTGDNPDANRFDGQIVAEHIRSAAGWCKRMEGGKPAKLARKLEKLLKQADKL